MRSHGSFHLRSTVSSRELSLGLLLLALVFLMSCGQPPSEPRRDRTGPRLVLVVSVDQLRGDYIDRFSPVLDGGLARMAREGVFFEEAHQDHAVTNTAPGHASISTGSYPRRSGIVSNRWVDRETGKRVYCVEDKSSELVRSSDKSSFLDGLSASEDPDGRSPRNLYVTALPDWLKSVEPSARIFSASYKDRSAILLGGKNPDAAYWYDGASGQFLSSRYYVEELPEWVGRFHDRKLPESYFGTLWEPTPIDPDVQVSLGVSVSDSGWFQTGFPHAIGGLEINPDSTFYGSFAYTPFVDKYLADFAREMIIAEDMGADEVPDYLGLGFSALDLIGHRYGPNSPEVLDTVVRLDGYLADFFEFLDERIGLDNIAIVLTSDHGVVPLPEYRRVSGEGGHRLDAQDIACLQRKHAELSAAFGSEEDWLIDLIYLNKEALSSHGISIEDASKKAASLLSECTFAEKIWTRADLESRTEDPYQRLFYNSFSPDRSADLMIQPPPYELTLTGFGTTHGSPHRYDTHVPIIFRLPGIQPARISKRVATIDIAPTLAALLGITPAEEIDGRDLTSLLEPGQSGD